MNCRAKTAGIELQSWFAVMPSQNMLLIDHVLVDDLGRFLLHLTASTVAIVPEQPGNGHGRQDVGLWTMAGQGQEELRLAELIICSWPHPSWNTGGCSVPGKSVSAEKLCR